jgi:cytochrome c oxidase subunit 3
LADITHPVQSTAHGGHSHPLALRHHFASREQQKEVSTLGMWVFLVTEVMFFGGMFLAYIVYRTWHPEGFAAGSMHLDIVLGGLNTAVLIASSLTMALAVRAAQLGTRRNLMLFLIATMALGTVFLVVKAFEWHHKWVENHIPGPNFVYEGPLGPNVELFFSLYFGMTGLHAFHMVIGIGILATLLYFAWRGKYTAEYNTPIDMAGLYWHFVDIIWIFLFPLLYLIDRHTGGH